MATDDSIDPAEKERMEKEFEQCCNDYGKAINEGRHQDAEEIGMRMMQLAMLRSMNEEPSQDMVWKQMARECEERGNWAGAEEAFKNALAIEREHERREFSMKTLLDLAFLYEILGRREEQMAQIEAAVEITRESEIATLRNMAFEAKAQALLANDDLAAAKSVACNAVEGTPDDNLHALTKSRALVLLARCEALLGGPDAAERILNQAVELTRAYGDSAFMGGVQGFYAGAAVTSAVIQNARGKKKEAATAYGEAVARARTIVEQPHLQGVRSSYRLAQLLKTYATYLEAAEMPADAADARKESEEILGRLQIPSS